MFALLVILLLLAGTLNAGEVRFADGRAVVEVGVWALPEAWRTDVVAKAERAAARGFEAYWQKRFEEVYRERYAQEDARWRDVETAEVRLKGFSGVSIEGAGMDSRPLMAIAGGVAPDVLYVNFRQSETYIRQGFLLPLDGYLGMTEHGDYTRAHEVDEESAWTDRKERVPRVHEAIRPVIERDGHVWALPSGGVLGKVMFYRKGLLEAAGVPEPKWEWTWDDLYDACRKIADPAEDVWGIGFIGSRQESAGWIGYLWGAGGEVLREEEGEWRAGFASRAGAVALEFYTRLAAERWVDASGRTRRGYAYRNAGDVGRKWEQGRVAFFAGYVDEMVLSQANPETTGMAPLPFGPAGKRGGEINARLQGVFAGVRDAAVRDAAFEYVWWCGSEEAMKIRTAALVEGGLGPFVNPRWLEAFGYGDQLQLAPKGWGEVFEEALRTGTPEPYERNCQLVYEMMTGPLQAAIALAARDGLPGDYETRLEALQGLLRGGANETDRRMLGVVPPEEQRLRRRVAGAALAVIAGVFAWMLRRIARTFAGSDQFAGKGGVAGRPWLAWALLAPALLTILVWHYLPLTWGSGMAFQDYRIMGGSRWAGLDVLGGVLWDKEWWRAVWNSTRYSAWVVALSFLPPVMLAVLLHEIGRGKVFFRLVFYLPAVMGGLVVIYVWRSFYEGTEWGMMNRAAMSVPVAAWVAVSFALAAAFFAFGRRLWLQGSRGWGAACVAAGVVAGVMILQIAWPVWRAAEGGMWAKLLARPGEPWRWLDDPSTAMFCCVLPMAWAGMGPGCLVYLAALKGLPDDFYDAAALDGAGMLDKILFVVLPALRPLLVLQFIGVFIASWNSAGTILAMTGGRGATQVAGLHIFYDAYLHLRFGSATAMAWLLGLMLIGFTVFQLRMLARVRFQANK
ncbi:MAG: extracellular solute-binding protein [Kiritimatiellaeota bacterium]|nr:extracellular solute-binding protein [Kiritimatiellota bacterium]